MSTQNDVNNIESELLGEPANVLRLHGTKDVFIIKKKVFLEVMKNGNLYSNP